MTPQHQPLILLTGGGAMADGVPAQVAAALAGLFDSVLDGRNSYLGTGVQEALNRAPRDFDAFLATAVADGAWSDAVTGAER